MAIYYIGSYDIIDANEFQSPAGCTGAPPEVWWRSAGLGHVGLSCGGDGARAECDYPFPFEGGRSRAVQRS